MKTAEKTIIIFLIIWFLIWEACFEQKQNIIMSTTSQSQILISSWQDTFAICETRPHLCHRHNARNVEGRHQSGDPEAALCTAHCALCFCALYSFTVLCTVCSYTVLYLFSSALFCLGHSSLVFDTWGLDAMIGGQSQIQR